MCMECHALLILNITKTIFKMSRKKLVHGLSESGGLGCCNVAYWLCANISQATYCLVSRAETLFPQNVLYSGNATWCNSAVDPLLPSL
jgi:hypothetical protein